MALEDKLKQAAVSTAIRHQMKNLTASRERVCRNLIDFGMQLSAHPFTKAETGRLQEELSALLDRPDVDRIRQWMIQKFLS